MTNFVPQTISPPDTVLPAAGAVVSLTVKPGAIENITELLTRLAVSIRDLDAAILHLTVFGSIGAHAEVMETLRRILGGIDWPVTWAEGAACDSHPIAGLQAMTLTGGSVERIKAGGRVVGSVFQDCTARHCLLGGLGPVSNDAPRMDQTFQTLDNLAGALALAGFSMGDMVRTWFYLDDILSWYDDFNRARNRIYSGLKFRTGSLPASTGVGARNPAGAALAVGAWAMQPLNPSAGAVEIASPLQCPAPAYGSSFSRAMELSSASGRHLLISGTASIAPSGGTIWPGDPRQQVAHTMRVMEAILRSRGMGLSDLTRATAYFKRRREFHAFTDWCAANGFCSENVVMAQCDVCRDDLLFELEADAWSPNFEPSLPPS
jgi:enamine deaminase RidA (YjgF/YER057c/UK114 family)